MLAPEVIAQAEKRIGQTIGGKWHLDRVIGVGGMAAVYEATHRNRNRVAIKLLHPILSLDEGTRHRFLREGYVANTIRHEGAVQVLDDELTEEGGAFLVMELLHGESIEDRMDRKGGTLEILEALELTEELLDVLCAAHDQGVIHRDIKPDNLFRTDEGRIKVLDFGIARLHQGDSRATRVGSFMGTPAYSAPEQARGRWDEVDARTDLYSVGATLFTCITGTHVHPAETSSEQLALAIGATARSLADALPQAPSELVQLVDKALSYEKDGRFQSARVMKAAVQKVRAGLKDVIIPRPVRSVPPASLADLTKFESGTTDNEEAQLPFASVYPAKLSVRILVGILAAGILASFVVVVAQNYPQARAEDSGTKVLPTSRIGPITPLVADTVSAKKLEAEQPKAASANRLVTKQNSLASTIAETVKSASAKVIFSGSAHPAPRSTRPQPLPVEEARSSARSGDAPTAVYPLPTEPPPLSAEANLSDQEIFGSRH